MEIQDCAATVKAGILKYFNNTSGQSIESFPELNMGKFFNICLKLKGEGVEI